MKKSFICMVLLQLCFFWNSRVFSLAVNGNLNDSDKFNESLLEMKKQKIEKKDNLLSFPQEITNEILKYCLPEEIFKLFITNKSEYKNFYKQYKDSLFVILNDIKNGKKKIKEQDIYNLIKLAEMNSSVLYMVQDYCIKTEQYKEKNPLNKIFINKIFSITAQFLQDNVFYNCFIKQTNWYKKDWFKSFINIVNGENYYIAVINKIVDLNQPEILVKFLEKGLFFHEGKINKMIIFLKKYKNDKSEYKYANEIKKLNNTSNFLHSLKRMRDGNKICFPKDYFKKNPMYYNCVFRVFWKGIDNINNDFANHYSNNFTILNFVLNGLFIKYILNNYSHEDSLGFNDLIEDILKNKAFENIQSKNIKDSVCAKNNLSMLIDQKSFTAPSLHYLLYKYHNYITDRTPDKRKIKILNNIFIKLIKIISSDNNKYNFYSELMNIYNINRLIFFIQLLEENDLITELIYCLNIKNRQGRTFFMSMIRQGINDEILKYLEKKLILDNILSKDIYYLLRYEDSNCRIDIADRIVFEIRKRKIISDMEYKEYILRNEMKKTTNFGIEYFKQVCSAILGKYSITRQKQINNIFEAFILDFKNHMDINLKIKWLMENYFSYLVPTEKEGVYLRLLNCAYLNSGIYWGDNLGDGFNKYILRKIEDEVVRIQNCLQSLLYLSCEKYRNYLNPYITETDINKKLSIIEARLNGVLGIIEKDMDDKMDNDSNKDKFMRVLPIVNKIYDDFDKNNISEDLPYIMKSFLSKIKFYDKNNVEKFLRYLMSDNNLYKLSIILVYMPKEIKPDYFESLRQLIRVLIYNDNRYFMKNKIDYNGIDKIAVKLTKEFLEEYSKSLMKSA